MSVTIIRGTNDKPGASEVLRSSLLGHRDLSGCLFIGYPIISTPEGRHRIDALLVSPDRGLVVFDLIEGTSLDSNHRDRQDDSANKLDARLKTHRALVRRRDLALPIHTVSFAPRVAAVGDAAGRDEYAVANKQSLMPTLDGFVWRAPDPAVYKAALSAIENISAIRKNRTARNAKRADSRGAKLQKLEESIATLDDPQGRAVIETVHGVQRIRGLAGSGKTIVLALKAAYLHAQHPDWRIAVTFNTRSLKGQFKRVIHNSSLEMGEEPDWQKVRILNAWGAGGSDDRSGLYYEFCSVNQLDYYDFGAARRRFRTREFANVCKHALTQSRQSGTRRPVYDAILVDEAQDLPDEFLQICYELLGDDRRLVYAYDELQNLVGDPVSSPEVMFGAHDDGTPRVRLNSTEEESVQDLILEKCYRNSRPVLATAHALGFGIYRKPANEITTGLIQMFESRELWREIGYRIMRGDLRDGCEVELARNGNTSPLFLEEHSSQDDLVQFILCENKAEQGKRVASEIEKNLREDELRHDDIVVINPNPLTTRKEVGPIRSRLLERGIDSHIAGVDTSADEFFRERTDSVTFTGVHRAKGNEAGMVYVVNAQDCHGSGGNLARIRNQLFVAITRSKSWVRVLGVGDGMKALAAEFEALTSRDFALAFTYPTADEREQMRIVHREMTTQQRKRVKKSERDLENLVGDLEAGSVHIEDLNQGILDKLRDFLVR